LRSLGSPFFKLLQCVSLDKASSITSSSWVTFIASTIRGDERLPLEIVFFFKGGGSFEKVDFGSLSLILIKFNEPTNLPRFNFKKLFKTSSDRFEEYCSFKLRNIL
jgi:hypothetical protein